MLVCCMLSGTLSKPNDDNSYDEDYSVNVASTVDHQLATQQLTGLSQMPRQLVEAADDPGAI